MDVEAWTWRHGHGDMDVKAWTWRHGHGDMDVEAWTWRHGHRDMDVEVWTWRHQQGDMDMETRTWRHGMELNCSSCKRKTVVCPFVDEETNGSYQFANGLNRLNGLA
jgi:hypothetical protein